MAEEPCRLDDPHPVHGSGAASRGHLLHPPEGAHRRDDAAPGAGDAMYLDVQAGAPADRLPKHDPLLVARGRGDIETVGGGQALSPLDEGDIEIVGIDRVDRQTGAGEHGRDATIGIES